MLKRNVDIGRVKPEVYADRAHWPEGMIQEWGADEGVSAAREHERRLLEGFRALRQEIDAFKPDVVLIWGDDQYENFRKDCVPAFCVYIFDEVTSRPLRRRAPPVPGEGERLGPADRTPSWASRAIARRPRASCRALLEERVRCRLRPPRRAPKRAWRIRSTTPWCSSTASGRGFRLPGPAVPRELLRQPAAARARAARRCSAGLARRLPAVADPAALLRDRRAPPRATSPTSPWRVALIASSSWSHGSLTAKHGRLYPDIEADRALVR